MITGTERRKPYFWVTWLTPLLVGEDSCEWKVWVKGRYSDLNKRPSDFDSAQWNENHTALLNELRDEYKSKSVKILTEGQTAWKIDGHTATVAGKMDLVTLGPNLIIDAKTGKPKDSHVAQIKIYLLAVQLGCIPELSGQFSGVLRYKNDPSVQVLGVDSVFKDRFFTLVRRLAGAQRERIPSVQECKFCDLADCPDRIVQETVVQTTEF